jgi:hypothetical protein
LLLNLRVRLAAVIRTGTTAIHHDVAGLVLCGAVTILLRTTRPQPITA